MPALLTRMSTLPNVSTASLTRASTAAPSRDVEPTGRWPGRRRRRWRRPWPAAWSPRASGDDRGPGPGERQRDGLADAARRTGHDGHAAAEIELHTEGLKVSGPPVSGGDPHVSGDRRTVGPGRRVRRGLRGWPPGRPGRSCAPAPPAPCPDPLQHTCGRPRMQGGAPRPPSAPPRTPGAPAPRSRRRRRASARRRCWRRRAGAGAWTASARSSGASRSSAGFISAQWNGALTASGNDTLGAARLRHGSGALDRGRRAGDHHLARAR